MMNVQIRMASRRRMISGAGLRAWRKVRDFDEISGSRNRGSVALRIASLRQGLTAQRQIARRSQNTAMVWIGRITLFFSGVMARRSRRRSLCVGDCPGSDD
jgi:hypothetical protein